MTSKLTVFVFFIAVCFSNTAFAEIDPAAPSASHKLETAADAMHGYLHHHYDSGYGSHQLEEAATEMHHALHEWQHGELSESDIDAMADDLRTVWNEFRQTIIPAGLLSAGDMELEALYADIKTSYKNLRFLLKKAK